MATLMEVFVTQPSASQTAMWNVIVVFTCCLGDWLCQAVSGRDLLWRALADSGTHGAVGAVSWAVVVLPGRSVAEWTQCLLCGLAASLIDLDHFVQAGSLQLKDAVTLQQRPPFHSTTLVLLVTGVLWVVSLVMHVTQLRKVALLCCVAWLTHHLRDASRRGLWFPPLGSSPPLPYAVYVVSTVAVAVAARCVYVWCVAVPSVHTAVSDPKSLSAVLVQ
ncbi:transmembrane protein 267-like [Littorina saxatilis]|uniref:Transmembrane protein 267 n=1 Tax=Littorina saxatilis TaxID=31220 RepID=A0AAN9B041_9CAEN